jgi:hypothetical protein
MDRLRATASAARSVLDGREHDGTLGYVGISIIRAPTTIKKLAYNTIKKPAHAYWHVPLGLRYGNAPLLEVSGVNKK